MQDLVDDTPGYPHSRSISSIEGDVRPNIEVENKDEKEDSMTVDYFSNLLCLYYPGSNTSPSC